MMPDQNSSKSLLKQAETPLMALVLLGIIYAVWKFLDLPTEEEMISKISVYFEMYGLVVVFLSAIIESILLVGSYYPGSLVILLGVIFAGKDIERVVLTVAVICAGLIIGYSINYFLGRYGWYRLLVRYGLGESIEKSKTRLEKHGTLGLFMAYWLVPIAALASTAAGVLKFPYKKFLTVSIVAVLAWNTLWGIVVYFLGEAALSFFGFKTGLIVLAVWIAIIMIRSAREKKSGIAGRATENIILINKPKGITSFDVIRRLRSKLGVKKMGHAGTLDPMAEGLLIVGIGKGTKELAKLIGLSKSYEAEIELGVRTDTGDRDGNVIEEKAVPETLDEAEVRNVLDGLVGSIELPVPAYSAVKQGGVPLYKRARKGESVDTPVRVMKITSIEFKGMRHENNHAFLSVTLDVGSGTYVRSIAEEIGKRLGYPATLSKLVRTSIGPYKLADAQNL